MKIDIEHSDLEFLLWTSMRYCMGRMTGVTSTYPNLLLKYKDELSSRVIISLREELKTRLKEKENKDEYLGMEMDHSSWKHLAHKLETV